MHGVMHLGWVSDGDGGYRGQMAVLVKPNGLFGDAYMAAIRPFRRLIVYPLMLRRLGASGERALAIPHGPRPLVAWTVPRLPSRRTGEQWARLFLEDAPPVTRGATPRT